MIVIMIDHDHVGNDDDDEVLPPQVTWKIITIVSSWHDNDHDNDYDDYDYDHDSDNHNDDHDNADHDYDHDYVGNHDELMMMMTNCSLS